MLPAVYPPLPPPSQQAAEVRPVAAADFSVDALLAFLLFVVSEAVGLSPRLRSNSLLQLILHMGQELFPYTLQRKQPPERDTRPQLLSIFRGGRERRR